MDRDEYKKYRYHTVAEAFEEICHKETPWVAIGNFLNDWWHYSVNYRRELIETPLALAPTPALHRWAAFCAAMVEWLCEKDHVSYPIWTQQEMYILKKPWFYYKDAESRPWLLATTPSPFKKRNIFVGDRMFLNKWDLKKDIVLAHRWTAEEMGLG